jgi:hypothetical protein
MKTYKFVDKTILQRINHLAAHILKYNRAVPDEVIDALPDDKFYPISFAMVHEHRAGKPCEPHMRCIFLTPNRDTGDMQHLIIDVEMGLYDLLPSVNAEGHMGPESPEADNGPATPPEPVAAS